MGSLPDRGSVLAADLVLGAAIVLAVAAIASGYGAVAGAAQDGREAARTAAVIAARTGDTTLAAATARRLAPGAVVAIEATADLVVVRVTTSLVAAHPVQRAVAGTVVGEAAVPVAPYRSNRG